MRWHNGRATQAEQHKPSNTSLTLDALEVVDDGDADARERVEDGQHDLLRRDGASVEHGVAAPPLQGDVAGAESVGALKRRTRGCRWR